MSSTSENCDTSSKYNFVSISSVLDISYLYLLQQSPPTTNNVGNFFSLKS